MLRAAADGDRKAAAELLPLLYKELRRLARSRLAKLPPGQTLQPTALVHEAYLRVIGKADPGWDHRGHFFSAAAEAMRRILVDQARRKASIKHGGKLHRVELEDDLIPCDTNCDDVLEVNEVLECLEALDSCKAQIVKLRYFAGLTREETAKELNVSVHKIKREWNFIRRWFKHQMTPVPE